MRPDFAQIDVDSVAWDLDILSIFFDRSVTVELEGMPPKTVGGGLGGFSWTVFNRGFQCTGCGNCCKTLTGAPLHRRLWFWWDFEPYPSNIETHEMPIIINGVAVPVRSYFNTWGASQCDHLLPPQTLIETIDVDAGTWKESTVEYCGIHEARPSHCMFGPALLAPTVNLVRGKRRLLSRRLPPRNWRWPQCPVDVYNSPIRQQDVEELALTFECWERALQHLPGSRITEAVDLWTKTVESGVMPRENLLFEDHFEA